MDCLKQIIGGCGMPPNFAEKTFVDGSQTSKSVKVFSLESFPLYGTDMHHYPYTTFLHPTSHKCTMTALIFLMEMLLMRALKSMLASPSPTYIYFHPWTMLTSLLVLHHAC